MSTNHTVRMLRLTVIIATLATTLTLAYRETAEGGIQGSGMRRVMVKGRITAFGSIFVNGVEYSTGHATVSVDDRPGTEEELRAGEVVTLAGTLNEDGRTGEASEVSVFADVVGPISRLDVANRRLQVLGQTVHVDETTLLGADSSAQLDSLQKGAVVRVSGFADSHGELFAARVDLAPSGSTLQVKGAVAAHDAVARTFQINGLTVGYAAIAPEEVLVDGAVVEVQGSQATDTVMQADRVHAVTRIAAPGARGDVQGIITAFTSAGEFSVNGQAVMTDSQTQFHGQTLGPDQPVRVKGVFDDRGRLVAGKVSMHPNSAVVLTGAIESISGNEIVVQGVRAVVVSTTVFEDLSSQPLKSFDLADLRVADFVQISGAPLPTRGAIVAASVRRADAAAFQMGRSKSVQAAKFESRAQSKANRRRTKG